MTQTVAPENFHIAGLDGNVINLSWMPIVYTEDGGYYEVFTAIDPGGPFSKHGETLTKLASTYSTTNLIPNMTYYLKVRTHTPAHGNQQNNLWSDFTGIVSVTTEVVGAQTAIDEGIGGTITYSDTQGVITTIEIPKNSVTDSTIVVYTEVSSPTGSAPNGYEFAGKNFNVNAYQGGAIIDGFTFITPITITFHYNENSLGGILEDTLMLFYWDEVVGEWRDAACGSYDRHLEENWLSVSVCHLSEFAFIANKSQKIFLPLIIR